MTDLVNILARCPHGVAMRRDTHLGYVIVELPDPASDDPAVDDDDPAVDDDELLFDPRRIPASLAPARIAVAAPTIPRAITKFAAALPGDHDG